MQVKNEFDKYFEKRKKRLEYLSAIFNQILDDFKNV